MKYLEEVGPGFPSPTDRDSYLHQAGGQIRLVLRQGEGQA